MMQKNEREKARESVTKEKNYFAVEEWLFS